MPSINNVWKSNTADGSVTLIELPSTQTALVRKMSMPDIISAGVMGDADSLTAIVDQKHIKRVRGGKGPDRDEVNVGSLMQDPQSLGRIVMVCDRLMPLIIQEPIVKLHFTDEPDGTTKRIPEADRDPNAVYTDQIGFEDKMFLLNWTQGGAANIESFRQQSINAMASVGNDESVPVSAKRTAGTRKRR